MFTLKKFRRFKRSYFRIWTDPTVVLEYIYITKTNSNTTLIRNQNTCFENLTVTIEILKSVLFIAQFADRTQNLEKIRNDLATAHCVPI